MLGVLGSIAAVANLSGSAVTAPHDGNLVACDEDGARFERSNRVLWESQARSTKRTSDQVKDVEGISIGEAEENGRFPPSRSLDRRGDISAGSISYREQGRVLEDEKRDIGIATSLAGRWSGLCPVTGRDHAELIWMDPRQRRIGGSRADQQRRPSAGRSDGASQLSARSARRGGNQGGTKRNPARSRIHN